MRSYLLDYRVGLYSDAGILISFTIGGMLGWLGLSAIGNRVDPMVAVVISGYMIWVGVSLMRHNLRSLMDLPLTEAEQLKVMRELAAHYDDYDSVGTLYTRSSGKRRFVEIELGFDYEQTVGHVQELSHHMEAALTAELPDLAFRIVPAWKPEDWATARGRGERLPAGEVQESRGLPKMMVWSCVTLPPREYASTDGRRRRLPSLKRTAARGR